MLEGGGRERCGDWRTLYNAGKIRGKTDWGLTKTWQATRILASFPPLTHRSTTGLFFAHYRHKCRNPISVRNKILWRPGSSLGRGYDQSRRTHFTLFVRKVEPPLFPINFIHLPSLIGWLNQNNQLPNSTHTLYINCVRSIATHIWIRYQGDVAKLEIKIILIIITISQVQVPFGRMSEPSRSCAMTRLRTPALASGAKTESIRLF